MSEASWGSFVSLNVLFTTIFCHCSYYIIRRRLKWIESLNVAPLIWFSFKAISKLQKRCVCSWQLQKLLFLNWASLFIPPSCKISAAQVCALNNFVSSPSAEIVNFFAEERKLNLWFRVKKINCVLRWTWLPKFPFKQCALAQTCQIQES